jgi:sec-independent protein translocase protein TatA
MPVGPTELIIVLVIVLVLFGAGKLADVGGALGKTVKGFREATAEEAKPEERESTVRRPADSEQVRKADPEEIQKEEKAED